MDSLLYLILVSLSFLAKVRAEPPVSSDAVAIVSDLDTTQSGGNYATNTYTSYQPGSSQSNGYTTAAVPSSTYSRSTYQAPRPTYGTAYLPVIPVSTSIYGFTPSGTNSDYGTYSSRSNSVYGTPQTWATSTQPWSSGTSNPWSSTQPWTSSSNPWNSSPQNSYGTPNPWSSQPWTSNSYQPWSSQLWQSSSSAQPWSSSPWSSSSSVPWSGLSRYGYQK